ncbi:hypothetical protein V9T40_008471 [Parthenolecanium corni]|uniref:POU domain protein n=1 Tax=Parthenolecanium corni TaxID=536013 RepID=A0AAN9TQN8_9HEMI
MRVGGGVRRHDESAVIGEATRAQRINISVGVDWRGTQQRTPFVRRYRRVATVEAVRADGVGGSKAGDVGAGSRKVPSEGENANNLNFSAYIAMVWCRLRRPASALCASTRTYSTNHPSPSAVAPAPTTTESTITDGDDEKRFGLGPGSPTEKKDFFPSFNSPIISRKEPKNYHWSAENTPLNHSVYDNNENLTNAPLNLSLNCSDSIEPEVIKHAIPQLLSLPNSTSIAQLILTSGQMVQGIQGAQLFVPTSQGLAKQIVLTIPITHVTTDQVINLSLTDGKIIPTTVGELLKLAMPKSIFDDDVTGEKIINELIKLSEQSSFSLADCLKTALKRGEKFHNDTKFKAEPDTESSADELKIDENSSLMEEKQETQKPSVTTFNGSYKKTKDSNIQNESSKIYSKRKHIVQNHSENFNNQDTSSQKLKMPKRSHESNQSTSDKISPPTALREEPSSTINHENENVSRFDSNFKNERTSPTDSYDENDLDDIKEFAKSFKLRRLSMGLTQTQVGQALNIAEGPAYSQSAICSALASHVYAAQIASQQHSIFEKLDITPKSAQKIKPVLERWMKEAEESYRNGQGLLTEFIGMESSKKRKRRTSFTPQALEILNSHFEHNTHPSGTEITALAHQLGYDREVIRIWFCNKRQALKNTVRMMSKHIM